MLGIFLDTEANGLNIDKHLPIEIALQVIDLSNGEKIESYHTLIHISEEAFKRSDPESLSFTGITYDELRNGKDFKAVKDDLIDLFERHRLFRGNACYICQNPSFDRTYFAKIIDSDTQEAHRLPYNWLDLASMHWSLSIRAGTPANKIKLSKDEIANAHGIPPENMPHRAENGVSHLVACYEKVVGFMN